jgi:fucose 4-O-acetylase-like acetyltransferase
LTERFQWVDILKGIGIVTVVLGHALPSLSTYMYWFHMPLFFFISGYLYKRKDQFVENKARSLLIPYFFFWVFITLIRAWHYGLPSQKRIIMDVSDLIFGGERLGGFYAVFWFVTCLLLTAITFYILDKFIKKDSILFLVISLFYFVSYMFSELYQSIEVPWSASVVLFSIVFFYLGNIYRKKEEHINRYNKLIFLSSTAISALFIVLALNTAINYELNMKGQMFYTFGFDVIIPLSFITLLIGTSKIVKRCSILSKSIMPLGESSLTIMYMHMTVLNLAPIYLGISQNSSIWLAILLPLLLHYLFTRLPLLSVVFLGSKPKLSIK